MEVYDRELYSVLSERMRHQRSTFDARGLANATWALGHMQHYHEDTFSAISETLQARLALHPHSKRVHTGGSDIIGA